MAQEKNVIKTIKKVMPSVVMVGVAKNAAELEKELRAENKKNGKVGKKKEILEIPKDKIDADGMVQIDGGSGFIVDPTGIILTNKHVISEPNAEYRVMLGNRDKFHAELLARDPVNDIAILKIKTTKPLPAVQIGDSSNLELGQTAIAFGNALGIFRNTVSLGIISGLARTITAYPNDHSPAQEMRGLIQTDAAINPGNSGGPLTDISGHVIGINAAMIAGAENIGFAIPINAAKRDLRDLKKYGKIKRPLLGIHYLLLNRDMSEKMKLKTDHGALIMREHPFETAIVPGGPADKAGFVENDIITEWNGHSVTMEKGILDWLENSRVGEEVTLSVLRDEKKTEIVVHLGERK